MLYPALWLAIKHTPHFGVHLYRTLEVCGIKLRVKRSAGNCVGAEFLNFWVHSSQCACSPYSHTGYMPLITMSWFLNCPWGGYSLYPPFLFLSLFILLFHSIFSRINFCCISSRHGRSTKYWFLCLPFWQSYLSYLMLAFSAN